MSSKKVRRLVRRKNQDRSASRRRRLQFERMEKRRLLATYTVTSSQDSGVGSLRAAIQAANATAELDTIEFDITTSEGAGPHTITLQSLLPAIVNPLAIDGYTETGASPNSLAEGNNAVLQVVLDGTNVPQNGVQFDGGGAGSSVSGLVIGNFGGHGVSLNSTSDVTVTGNFIGVAQDGTSAAGNNYHGVFGFESSNSTIGGGTPAARNVISGNNISGVQLTGQAASGNVVSGNFIGTNRHGTAAIANALYGVRITGGASSNVIGVDDDGVNDATEGNLISGNARSGVRIEDLGSDNNTVAGNLIGTQIGGDLALGNGTQGNSDGWGVVVFNGADGTVVGTDGDNASDEHEGNVIAASISHGVYIVTNVSSTVVAGNMIGTNQDGTQGLGNLSHGVYIQSAANNRIGSNGDGVSDALEKNVISANVGTGVFIWGNGANQNWVAGNHIGTDESGMADLGNTGLGINVSGTASDNVIGTDGNGLHDAAERNVISGNDAYAGVQFAGNGTQRNVFAGNYLGINAAGNGAIPNQGHPISVSEADDTRIGTDGDGVADEAERNVISGNWWSLVIQHPTTERTVIAGNYIGTDATGSFAVGNGTGVEIRWGAKDTRIGTDGSDDAFNLNERNVISGNNGAGIFMQTPNWNGVLPSDGSTNDGTVIAGNIIGLNASGTARLQNGSDGVRATNHVTNLRIGTDGDGIADEEERNIISGNNGDGIEISGWDRFNLSAADSIIAGDVARQTETSIYPQVDVYNSGNQGSWGFNHPVPGGGGDRYVIKSSGKIQVTQAGFYSFVVGSDNGSRLKVDGSDVVVFDVGNVGFRENFGTKYLNVGEYDFEMVGFEGGGGSAFEVSVAVGSGLGGPVTEANGWRVLGATNAHSEIYMSTQATTTAYYPSIDLEATIAGNLIGTDETGKVDLGNNQRGLLINRRAQGLRIGTDGDGLADQEERNVVSGNQNEGIRVEDSGTRDIVIAGNYVGTDIDGLLTIQNSDGIHVRNYASDVLIGTDGLGDTDAERNLVSGNVYAGIRLHHVSSSNVAGNFVGTDKTGTLSVPNGRNSGFGVMVHGVAENNFVGTNSDGVGDAAEGNLVSGNEGWNGIFLANTTARNNVVAGNLVGTDVTGTLDLGNRGAGIEIKDGASHNRIGTDADGFADGLERNVISGNEYYGVFMWIQNSGAPQYNTIAGNYIGTDINGVADIGNESGGIHIVNGPTNNLVGSDGDGVRDDVEANVIAGNDADGIVLENSHDNTIAGNLIGLDKTGLVELPNAANGILLISGASNNTIGGSPNARNVIGGHTTGAGIFVEGAGPNNWIASNYVGIGVDGATDVGNFKGIAINNGQAQIVGTNSDQIGDDKEGNVVSANTLRGIETAGNSQQNVIAGNYVGTDPTGAFRIGSQTNGVTLGGNSQNNLVGTDGDGRSDGDERNVIAGAGANEVALLGSGVIGNRVAGNYIGLGADGSTLILNGDRGVAITNGASGNIIGTNSDGLGDTIEGNVIGGMSQMGVWITGADSNVVAGNLIGTDRSGLIAKANKTGVQIEGDSIGNVIGTNGDGIHDDVEGNTISGNSDYGVWLRSGGNVVAGNLIGTDQTGLASLPNLDAGVFASEGASRIGTDGDGTSDTLERNVISGNSEAGVILASNGNVVAGNFIGLDIRGDGALGNVNTGVRILGENNLVGGDTSGERNVISGNTGDGYGVEIQAINSTVEGNYIGLNAGGDDAVPNVVGVAILSGSGNLIGTDGNGNVISGNSGAGVAISGANANHVRDNLIGTSPSGFASLPNHVGVAVGIGATGNVIGTDGDGSGDSNEGNLISGNANDGVSLIGTLSSGNVVAGNVIGLSLDGVTPLPNNGSGVLVGQSANRIGTDANGVSDELERNVISGNLADGVTVSVGDDHVIAGNYVGTDITGTLGRGNASSGVSISGTSRAVVGGDTADERNVISGNVTGIHVGGGAVDTTVTSNFIGTDVTGTLSLGNTATGIEVDGAGTTTIGRVGAGNVIGGGTTGVLTKQLAPGATAVVESNFIGTDFSASRDLGQTVGIQAESNTTIGGTGEGEANVITNQDTGVLVVSGTVGARGNKIYGNQSIGIDLTNETAKPFLNSGVAGAETVITGDLFAANGTYQLDFYADLATVADGQGQARRYLGSVPATVVDGQAAFTTDGLDFTLNGESVTATATDASGQTSEFSTSVFATTDLPPTIDAESLLTYIIDPDLDEATFGLPTRIVNEGSALYLTGDFSSINGDASVKINWGDGTHSDTDDLVAVDSSSFTAFHVYDDDNPTATPQDEYPVTVTVTDSIGSGSATLLVTVANVDPIVSNLVLDEATITEGDEVSISGSFVDPGLGDQHRLRIDWGDGSTPQSIVVPVGSRTFEATHTFTQDTVDQVGQITVTIRDDDGQDVVESIPINVLNAAPTASINLPSSPIEGITASISANAFDPGGDPLSFEWVVDGQVFETESVDYAAPNDGPIDVSVTVTDDRGAATTVSTTLVIGNAPPTLSRSSVNIRSAVENEPITEGVEIVLEGVFEDTGLSDAHQIEVDFGDGSPIEVIPVEFGGRAYSDIRHTYADDPDNATDTYTVSVTLRDESDASTVIVPLVVPNFIPEVSLRNESTSDTQVSVGANVVDRGLTDRQFYEWFVDGDAFLSGSVDPGQSIPSITFANPGGDVEIVFRSTDDDGDAGETVVRYFVFDDADNTIEIAATGGDGVEVTAGEVTTPVSGADQILVAAGGGNDIILIDTSGTETPVSIQADLGDGDDSIVSGGGDDVIFTGAGDDSVNAGDGNDVIVSNMGDDTINGGGGENEIQFELFSSKTLIDGGGVETLNFERVPAPGTGTAVDGISLDLSKTDGTVQTVYSTTGKISLSGTFENVVGSGFADRLVGNDAQNILFGGLGNDSIVSSGGGDTLGGGEGDDSIFGGPGGDDSIDGGDGADTINSGAGSDDTIFGGSGNDSIISGGGGDTIGGGEGDDTIFGGPGGSESIDGGLGDDVIRGDTVGDGTDTIFGGPGNDSIVGGISSDTVLGGDGDDSIFGGPGGNESIDGGAGDDSIIAGDGDTDTIFGGPGDDSIRSGIGSDTIDGGDGDDSIFGGPGGNESINGGSGDDTIVGGADGNDTIFGGSGADSISAGGGNDTIDGGGGDDTIFGGPGGHESISGGSGDDSISVGDGAGDTVFGGPGNDSIVAASGDDPDDAIGDTIDGGSGDDTIFGGPGGHESISGGAGNDSIEAGDGESDTIFGGAGDDSIVGGQGGSGDTIDGGVGDDTIFGGPGGNESISGGAGDDSIEAGDGTSDTIFGGSGNDTITSAGGDDTISGGEGDDTIFGGPGGNESIDGGAGDDTIDAGTGGVDTIFGGSGDDSIVGSGDDADTILGGEGDDTIFGGSGANDSIDGGGGDDSIVSGGDPGATGPGDTVFGGSGDDSIVSLGGSDTIDGGDGDDTIFGGPGGNESIHGGGGDDTIVAGDGEADSIFGGSGDDSLVSGGGASDTIGGGDGDDTIFGGPGSDESIDGGSGDDSIVIGGGHDTVFGGLGNDSIVSTGGADTIDGGEGDDSIFGGPGGDDSIIGGDGNDTINAGGGSDDTVFGGDGDDLIEIVPGLAKVFGGTDVEVQTDSTDRVLIESDANITVSAGAASNLAIVKLDDVIVAELSDIDEVTLIGGDGNNILDAAGFVGNSALVGRGGDDTLIGGIGEDSIEGGTGDDSLVGGLGDDRYIFVGEGDLGSDVIDETVGADHDTLDFFGMDEAVVVDLADTGQQTVSSGLDLQFSSQGGLEGVIGTTFADKLTGNSRDNELVGGGGIDSVFGGAGDDVISASRTKRVYLDFDSSTGTEDHVYSQAERDAIEARMKQDFAAFDVQVSQVRPIDPVYVTIFFNSPPEFNGRAFSGGVADRIGWRDVARGGSVQVDVNGFFGTGRNQLPPTDDNFVSLSSTIASHELGHMYGLRHHDSFGSPGEGVFTALGGTAFLPNYDDSLVAAPETSEHLLASPASVRTTLTDALANPYFGEREALKLAFSETGITFMESDLPSDNPLTIGGTEFAVQSLGTLRPLSVPNTIENPNAANYNVDLGAAAASVVGSIDIDPTTEKSENDIYSFQASAGDVVTVETLSLALRTRIDFTVDTLLRVYDSTGTKLDYYGSPLGAFNDDGFEPTDSILIDVIIPSDGTYYVEVDSFNFHTEEFSTYVPGFDVGEACSESGDIRCDDTDTGDYELLIYRFDPEATSAVGDIIVGGEGADTLVGSSGNDFFLADSSDVIEGPVSKNQTIATNTKPVIDAFTTVTAEEGDDLVITSSAQDGDFADEIRFSLSSTENPERFPVGAVIDPFTGTIIWDVPDDGAYEAVVTVTDLSGETASETLVITASNVDPIPTLTEITGDAKEGSSLSTTGNATDAAGANDTLTFLYETLVGGVVVDSETGIGLSSYDFVPGDEGDYTVRLTVSDEDGGSASVSRNVTVSNVAPTAVDDHYAASQDAVVNSVAAQGVLANDSDAVDSLAVTKINGEGFVPGVELTLPSGALLSVSSDGAFVYDPNDQFDWLPKDATIVDRFTYDVSDGTVAVQSTVSMTLTGVNDQPVISVQDVTGESVEDSAAALTESGSVVVSDADQDSSLQSSIELGTVVTTGPAVTPELTAALDAAISMTSQPDGTLLWNFSLDNSEVQYLREGQTVTATYELTVSDGTGQPNESATQVVTMVITGKNGQPVITSAEAAGGVIEDANPTLADSGSIQFADEDHSDVISTSVSLAGATTTGPVVPAALADALENAVTLNQTGGRNGAVEWTFQLDDDLVQYLADEESVTATYTVTVSDDSGASDAATTQDVVILIEARNDRPQISPTDVSGSVNEDQAATLNDGGVMAVSDSDATDIVTTSVELVSTTTNGPPMSAELTTALANAVALSAGAGSDVHWSFELANGLVDYLGRGESIDATYTVTAQDDSGTLTDSTAISLQMQIVGQNDRPTITVVDVDGEVTEDDSVEFLVDSGSVTFADVDLTDSVSSDVTFAGAETNSVKTIPADLLAALDGAMSIGQTGTRDGTIAWDFAVLNSLVEYLTSGETVTASYLVAVQDDSEVANASETQTVQVVILGTNAAPRFTQVISSSATLATAGNTATEVSLGGTFYDENPDDTHLVTVDWGDGSAAESVTVIQDSPTTRTGTYLGTHEYDSGGIFTITVTIDDGNGGLDVQTATAYVSGVRLVDGTLYVIGTSGKDDVEIEQKKLGELEVEAEFKDLKHLRDDDDDDSTKPGEVELEFDSADVHRIVVLLGGEDDDAEIDAKIPTIIDGGDGKDDLEGGDDRDILIGGLGKDDLEGGGGQDILIDGTFVGSLADLDVIASLWNAEGDYVDRVSSLLAEGGPLDPPGKIQNDDSSDDVEGDDAMDLFFLELGRDDDDRRGQELVNPTNPSDQNDPSTGSVSGFVWDDANRDNLIGMNEMAMPGVTISLYNAADEIVGSAVTDEHGSYAFNDLPAGVYRIVEQQPLGYSDGAAVTQNGGLLGTNQVSMIELNATEVLTNFNFSDHAIEGSEVEAGQTATIAFWYGKSGQKVIDKLNGTSRATNLGDYLATHFPNMFGDYVGLDNKDIKSKYKKLYKERFIKSDDAGDTKLELEVLSLAISTYVTTRSLVQVNAKEGIADDIELVQAIEDKGFSVNEGVGVATYDLSVWIDNPYTEADIRATFNLSDTDSLVLSVFDILKATDAQSGAASSGTLYDLDANGISGIEQILRSIANTVYADINNQGAV